MRLGSDLSLEGKLRFAADGTYIGNTADTMNFFAGGNRGMSITSSGGSLHGLWTSDQAVTTSDRRLKKSIVPLYRAISEAGKASGTMQTASKRKDKERDEAVGWIMRELRPVSFKFKNGPEGKHQRYGFVAQELQQVLPDLVRGQGEKHLAVAYQDLIALLTLAAQVLQEKVKQQEETLERLVKIVEEIDQRTRWLKPPGQSA